MRRSAFLLALALTVWAIPSPARAQPAARTNLRPFVYYALAYLGNDALHKELKLSADQVKKINELRTRQLARFPMGTASRGRTRPTQAAVVKESEKLLTEILSEKQIDRMRQVVAQKLMLGDPRQLTPEVVTELKLTAQQSNDLRARGSKLDAVLSKEQMEAWKKMSGPAFGKSLVLQVPFGRGTDRGMWGGPAAPQPTAMIVLALAAGRKELGLTPEQIKDIDELALFGNDRAAKRLELTEQQQKTRDEAFAQARTKLAELLLKEDDSGLEEKSKALRKETLGKVEGMLTPAQRGRLKDLLGPSFEMPRSTRSPIGRDFGTRDRAPTLFLADLVGRELNYLGAPELPIELQMTAEQARKVADFRARFAEEAPKGQPNSDSSRKEVQEKFDKELAEILGADRRKRFRQMVLQVLEKPIPTSAAPASVWSLPEVVELLKLTPRQVGRLAFGLAPEKVLTEGQSKQWLQLKGEPFKGELTLPATRSGFRTGTIPPVSPIRYRYLAEKSVQAELKLTEEQSAEVTKALAAWQDSLENYRTWTESERTARVAKSSRALKESVDKLLKAEQSKRFEQILMQNLSTPLGRSSTGPATVRAPGSRTARSNIPPLSILLRYPPALKALEVTGEQVASVADLLADSQRRTPMIALRLNAIPHPGRDDLAQRTTTAYHQQTEKQLLEVLTEKQQSAVKGLLGEPFKGTFENSRNRRGRGGAGGGPAEPR